MVLLCLQGKIQIPYRHIRALSWPGSSLAPAWLLPASPLSYLIMCFSLTSYPAHPSLRPQQAHYTSQKTPCSLSIAGLLKKPFLTPDPSGKVPFSFMNHWISLYPLVKFLALPKICLRLWYKITLYLWGLVHIPSSSSLDCKLLEGRHGQAGVFLFV